MISIAIVVIAGAMLLVRAGWGGLRGYAPAGWALAAAALAWLIWMAGAWGLSVGLVAGSLVSLGLVMWAGAISPRRPARRTVEPSIALAADGRLDIARRLAVFLVVVPASFVAAQWLAYAINTAMKGDAPLDANSVATMLCVQPLAWSILMAWQMTFPRPRQMILPPALAAILGTLIWLIS